MRYARRICEVLFTFKKQWKREASDFFKLSFAAQYPSHTFLRAEMNVARSPLPCRWFPGILDDELAQYTVYRVRGSETKAGVDINPNNLVLLSDCFQEGYTPLHLAAYHGHYKCCRTLIFDHGADVNICDDVSCMCQKAMCITPWKCYTDSLNPLHTIPVTAGCIDVMARIAKLVNAIANARKISMGNIARNGNTSAYNLAGRFLTNFIFLHGRWLAYVDALPTTLFLAL